MQANDRPLYIFDLDGTMALIEHRRHLVEGPMIHDREKGGMKRADPDFKPDWRAFYEACHMDAPNMPVIKTFCQLYTIGAELMVWSGREDSVRQKSILWLSLHTGIVAHMIEQMLKMRPAGDYTPDEQLKRKWLNQLQPNQRQRLTAVFDDRDKVVDMWRKEGVACFQVAPGQF
jgi:hypothetical protein